jgi:hypothetical protein
MSIASAGPSSSSLMSWLITHNNDLNSSLDSAMHQGDLNVGVQKELKDLENHMKDVVNHGYGNVAQEMADFIQKHQGDPECAAISQQLAPMQAAYAKAQQDWQTNEKTCSGADLIQKRADLASSMSGKVSDLESMLDSMKKMDELQMTRINDLSSQRNQAFQLASNMMAGTNQVLGGLINNIKG